MKSAVIQIGFILVFLSISSCVQREYYQYLARENEQLSLDYYYRALDFYDVQQLDSALYWIGKAIEVRPTYAPYYFLEGQILKMQHKNDSAKEVFLKALENKSFYPEVWEELADMYFNEGNFQEALKYYLRLNQHDPTIIFYRLRAAICSNRLNKPIAALDFVLGYRLSDSEYFHDINREIIYAYKLQGDNRKALEMFQSYLEKVDGSPDCSVLELILEVYSQKEEMETLLSLSNKGLSQCPQNPIWHYYRYMYFKQKDKDDLAEVELQKIEQKIEFQPSLRYFLGRYYFEKKRYDKCAEHWQYLTDFSRLSNAELTEIFEAPIAPQLKKKFAEELYKRTGKKEYKNWMDKKS